MDKPTKDSLILTILFMVVIVLASGFGYWAGSERSRAEITFALLPCQD